MLFFRHWMTIGIPFVDKFCRGLYLSHTWNTTWHSPICQPSVVIHLLFVRPGGYLMCLKYPQSVALFEPDFLIFFFKHSDPVFVWLWNFSNIQNRRFFDSDNFLNKIDGYYKFKYPPHLGFFPRWPM